MYHKFKSVNPKGNQPWIFIGRTDAEAETPILWPPDVKSWLSETGGHSNGISVSASVLPMNIPGLIAFRIDWFDLLAVQRTLKSLLQHCSSKASILHHSAFFIVPLSYPYMISGKTIGLTRWTFVGKVMSLLFNMPSRLVIIFLPRSKHLLISWLQSLLGYCLKSLC